MYLLKQKAVPHPFSSLFLWKEMYRNTEADTPWEKLKKSLLLVLQILTVIALVIALMAPYVRSKSTNAGHVILVIDNSASMNTMYDDKNTRLDVAVSEAVSFVEKSSSGTAVSIVTSNKDAVLLLSDSADKALAVKRLKAIEKTDYAGSCDAGTEMVRSMAVQWASCQVIYYTDSMLANASLGSGGFIVDVYSDSENAYVEYVGHGTNADGTLTVIAKITNDTKQPLTDDINLYGDGKIIDVRTGLNIPSGSSDIVYFENVNFNGNSISVEINGLNDALADDNRSFDVITGARKCETLLMTKQNLYLEKAAGIVDGINITKSDDTDAFLTLADSSKYNLFIFDGILPDELPAEGNIILINAFDSNLVSASEELTGIRVKAEDSKLTSYLSALDFGVSKAHAIDCPSWAESFLTARQDGNTYCIGCWGNYEGRTICALGFDFHDSDLPLMMEFPILMFNILSECAGTGMLQSVSVNTGVPVKINGSLDGSIPFVTTPDGSQQTLSGNISVFTDTAKPGIYTVSQKISGDTSTETFSVNFPISESKVLHRASLTTSEGNTVVENEKAAMSSLNLRNLFIIIILVLLVIEWIVYLRGM